MNTKDLSGIKENWSNKIILIDSLVLILLDVFSV